MKERLHLVPNDQGWLLEVRQYWDPNKLQKERRPVLMIPGYCMNTFILNYHPGGDSMVKHLVDRGAEVWTANLRGQGGSRKLYGRRKFGFRELSLVDIPRVIEYLQAHAKSDVPKIDAVGCSLGATFLYAYLAHHQKTHSLGGLVSIGGPLRWETTHPLMNLAFQSPRVAGMLPVLGTRRTARTLLPIARRLPFVLDLYMNRSMIDLSQADELVQTVDDPVPYLNMQIAHWFHSKDLEVGGVNVTQAMSEIEIPALCIVANADGIVPPDTASSLTDVLSGEVEVLHVGDKENWFAHADLFISNLAHREVFDPLSDWMIRHNS